VWDGGGGWCSKNSVVGRTPFSFAANQTRTPHNFHHKNYHTKTVHYRQTVTNVPSISKAAERLNATWLLRREPRSPTAVLHGSAEVRRTAANDSLHPPVHANMSASMWTVLRVDKGPGVLEQLRDSQTMGLVSDPAAAFPCPSTSFQRDASR
jgi:hypothetical protein